MLVYVLIYEDVFSVYALEKDDGSCDIAELLDISYSKNKEDGNLRVAMVRRIQRLAEGNLPISNVHHSIDKDIWQISSGKYRLLYFYDAGRRIICTHYFVKEKDKTPRKEISKAQKHRDDYFKAQNENTIRFKD